MKNVKPLGRVRIEAHFSKTIRTTHEELIESILHLDPGNAVEILEESSQNREAQCAETKKN